MLDSMLNRRNPLLIPAMSRADMRAFGWSYIDVLLISGDAYVDHPSFPVAVLSKVLLAHGYRVGVVAQPEWRNPYKFEQQVTVMGKPRLAIGIVPGAVDSLIANYTSFKNPRVSDAYSPNGVTGKRPDRALIVYAQLCRRFFKGVPIIGGGIEGTTRRFAHYDWWSDTVRRSILLDARLDILVYGPGEKTLLKIVDKLSRGYKVSELRDLKSTVVNLSRRDGEDWLLRTSAVLLPDFRELKREGEEAKFKYLEMQRLFSVNQLSWLAQWHDDRLIAQNPMERYERVDLDWLYSLPWLKEPHPHYGKVKIPAWYTIKDSIVISRGCPAGCSFCTIRSTQGSRVISRSVESVVREVEQLVKKSWFKGTVSDIGAPTPNITEYACPIGWVCVSEGKPIRRACISNVLCHNFSYKRSHKFYLKYLYAVKRVRGVHNVFVASGLRYELLAYDREFLEELIKGGFIGGQISVAPEHVSPKVLKLMRKPDISIFDRFRREFNRLKRKYRKDIYIVPYFISAFPGATLDDAKALGEYVKRNFGKVEQIQDFIPIPLTDATAMFYTEMDLDGRPIYVAKRKRDRLLQRQVVQPWVGRNHNIKGIRETGY